MATPAAYDPDADLASMSNALAATQPPVEAYDPDKDLMSMSSTTAQPQPKVAQPKAEQPYNFDLLAPSNYVAIASNIGTNISGGGGAGGVGEQMVKSAAGSIAGGLRGLWDLVFGKTGEQAANDVTSTQQAVAPTPTNPKEQAAAEVATSPYNPINVPANVLDFLGRKAANVTERMGAPAGVQTTLRIAPTALAFGYGAARGMAEPGEEIPPGGSPPGAPAEPIPEEPKVDVKTPIDEIPPEQQKSAINERDAILNRVGINSIRNSATEANPKDAATDFQLSKTDTPAGNAAKAQFQHEIDAMTAKSQDIIDKTGGTSGLDEDSLANRGVSIASPFDKLGQFLDQKIKDLYTDFRQRAGLLSNVENPQAVTNLDSVMQKLNDPTFVNQVLAKNQGHLLNAVGNQLEFFRKQNPNGFTPATAEQFRQFLNQAWSPDTKWAIGQLVDATDKDVISAAGEDMAAPARAAVVLKKAVLENPDGVSDLFSSDPKTPMNRSTPYEKIPDTLMRLPIQQFQNILQTLRGMPEEIQSDAQAAIAEIKAHFANKIQDTGISTGRGNTRNLWNAGGVNDFLKRNSAKMNLLFADDPQGLASIKDLQNAGNILKVDPSYPGAYAQEVNLKGRGIAAKVAPIVGEAGGAAAGSIFGPTGAAGGAYAGRAAGESVASKMTAKAALEAWKKRIHIPGQ